MRLIAGAVIAAVLSIGARAGEASTVRQLSLRELADGADRVIDGTVTAVSARWATDRRGIETLVSIATTAGEVVEVVIAGGTIGNARHVVVGMPTAMVGERARWYLRSRGDGTFRVYGWGQGKMTLAGVAATTDFATNGMVWPAAKMPVRYLFNRAGSDDLAQADAIAAVDAAFATWQAVPTATLSFTNGGLTDLGLAVDDNNVVLFVESGWTFGAEAAAATSLFIIDGQQTADIAVNGENYRWAIGPANADVTRNVLDLQAVMTHEIGHFSGLGHSKRAFDTMYLSWKPWQSQRTLSIDDKLGLTSIYPIAGDECDRCAVDEPCAAYAEGNLCTGTPDPVGTPCNYDRVECDEFCLFTALDLSTGYCSRLCEIDRDCPRTHHCAPASAGSQTVRVCTVGAQPPCSDDNQCRAGEYCDLATGDCAIDCRTSDDCGGATCDDHGRCAPAAPGGCGCASEPGAHRGWWAAVIAVVLWRATCRRQRPR